MTIKQLASLTVLGSVKWDRDGLLVLLRPPHALHRLEEIELGPFETVDLPLLDGSAAASGADHAAATVRCA